MPDELYHFSEDASIARFEPQVTAPGTTDVPLVWAIDAESADLYCFPRDCPRVTFHARPDTTTADRERFLGLTSARRVAAIEAAWLDAMRSTTLHRYVLPGDSFELRDLTAGYWVSRQPVVPLRKQPVGDLIDALIAANVELRVMPSLWPLYRAVVASTLGFSVIRWRNAAPEAARRTLVP